MVTERSEPKSSVFAGLALAVPALLFLALPPLWKSGLWEPYELGVADPARRLALNLLGGADLALSGADNGIPHLNDLGRPQLPFTSIALGFRLFGLHEWAGRLPLALWGIAGVAATYGALSRLVDRRAGIYAAVALSTMPAYLVQSRTMMGEITTMAAVAIAFSGLAVATFDTSARPLARAAWAGLGALGLAAGYASRGSILGVMVPCLAVGLAKVVEVTSGERRGDAMSHAVAGLALVLGGVAAALGAAAFNTKSVDVSVFAGGVVKAQSRYPTFDYYIGHIGHALVPWSAFAPFAFGRLFLPPVSPEGTPAAAERESGTRAAVLLGAALAFAAHGWIAPRLDLVAFTGPVFIAAACGIALRDFERGAHASIALAVGTLVLAGVFHHDFHELPEKAYQAFGVLGAAFPESFKQRALGLWWVALGGFAMVAFLTWAERDPERRPFDPKSYLRVSDGLRDAWDGTVVLMWLALVAGLSVASLVVWMGLRYHWKLVAQLGGQLRDVLLNGWWVALTVPPLVIFGILFACDTWLWAFNRARPLATSSLTRGFEPFEDLVKDIRGSTDTRQRGASVIIIAPIMLLAVPGAVYVAAALKAGLRPGVSIALAVPSGIAAFLALGVIGDLMQGKRSAGMAFFAGLLGVALSLFYYPALANQLSPKDVFETYQRVHKGSEPLGLFGVGGRTAAYYAGGQPPSFTEAQGAHKWLTGGGERRFLAVKAEELPRLNMAYREASQPRVNLPVVDARSSQILLAASSLESAEKNENPFATSVLTVDTAPKPQRRLDVNMEDKLVVVGIDLADTSGKLVDTVAPGKAYKMRTYFKVLAPVGSEWEFFIHIDGYRKRHNGDHKVMGGKYPMALWLPGDVLIDEHELTLEPNFTPGQYTIFFGLYVGETRLKVKSGASDGDNRINGGALRVQ